jgi:hypothetical protein
MKRSPLRRKTPLRATTRILTRTGLKRVSKKRRAVNADYSERRDIFLGLHDCCQVENCTNESAHIHHLKGRDGANLLDETTWLACCPICHRRIHDNPAWAYEKGYLISRHTKRENE